MKKIKIELTLHNNRKTTKIIEKIAKTLDIKIEVYEKNKEQIILQEVIQE